jgi:uncharacterized membrane protein
MTDYRLEQLVGTLLRAGVLLSAAVVAGGGAWWLAEMARTAPAYSRFQGEPPELRHVGLLIASLAHPRPEILIQLGLLILIATPVARVALALVGFALERDLTYVVVTLVVLSVLIYTLVMPFGADVPTHATGLRRTPMPSMSTSTTSPAASLRVAPGVPVKMRSPGISVTHRLIQLTMVAQSKMKSAVRSF